MGMNLICVMVICWNPTCSLLYPIIPESSKKVLKSLKIDEKSINLTFLDGNLVLINEAEIENLEILFKKIS